MVADAWGLPGAFLLFAVAALLGMVAAAAMGRGLDGEPAP